jgi:hypothetical protein
MIERRRSQSAPPLRFAIDGFLQEAGVTLIGGLAGHGRPLSGHVCNSSAFKNTSGVIAYSFAPFHHASRVPLNDVRLLRAAGSACITSRSPIDISSRILLKSIEQTTCHLLSAGNGAHWRADEVSRFTTVNHWYAVDFSPVFVSVCGPVPVSTG